MYTKARELGGKVSGEHGIGFAKKVYLETDLGETRMQLLKGIKKVEIYDEGDNEWKLDQGDGTQVAIATGAGGGATAYDDIADPDHSR